MESWQAILDLGSTQGIRCAEPQVQLYGDLALVVCYEGLQNNYLLATNGFVQESEGWKLIHHQAAQTSGTPSVVFEEVLPSSIN